MKYAHLNVFHDNILQSSLKPKLDLQPASKRLVAQNSFRKVKFSLSLAIRIQFDSYRLFQAELVISQSDAETRNPFESNMTMFFSSGEYSSRQTNEE